MEIAVSGPESALLTSAPSNSSGIAEAQWQTQRPNKKGQGGTSSGLYTVTVTDVAAGGYTWDGVATSKQFTLQ